MANPKKALATELKDLDVDRVDGVDRPATGRAFALYKSETPTSKKEETIMAETTVTKAQLDEIMKGYAAVATAADMLLKALRKDAKGNVSKSTAIAVNGLAQIMGSTPVFKAVPGIDSQPYQIEDPMRDENGRGPADENLGANFTPRSMPGSMVGKVQFSVKGTEKAAPVVPGVAPAVDEEEGKLPWMKSVEAFNAAVAKAVAAEVAKTAVAAPVVKVEKTEVPASKQVMTEEQKQVRKSAGYRMGESFENVVFTARA